MELRLFISLFSILFIGLLGVYGLALKIMKDVNEKLGKIYETINGHMRDTAVHIDSEHPMVTEAVCLEVQKRNEVHFDSLATGQQEIKSNIKQLMDKLL